MAGAKLKDGDILLISDAVVAAEPADAAAYETILDASTAIANVVTAPSMGYTVNTANHDYLDSTFSSPDKGIAVGDTSEIVVGLDPDGDAGQAILEAAAKTTQKGRYVISIQRLDGSVTSAWGPVSGYSVNGGSNGTHNEVTSTFMIAAEPVTYTPTP
jgi:hypothetical protein